MTTDTRNRLTIHRAAASAIALGAVLCAAPAQQPGQARQEAATLPVFQASVVLDGDKYEIKSDGSRVTVNGEETANADAPTGFTVKDGEGNAVAWIHVGPRSWQMHTMEGERKSHLGVTIEELDEDLADHLDVERGDVLIIREVEEGGPAHKAGLRKNDVITALEGQSPVGREKLRELLESHRPGDSVRIDYLRKGKRGDCEVKLGGRRAAGMFPWVNQYPGSFYQGLSGFDTTQLFQAFPQATYSNPFVLDRAGLKGLNDYFVPNQDKKAEDRLEEIDRRLEKLEQLLEQLAQKPAKRD
jgi:hypothetical protein